MKKKFIRFFITLGGDTGWRFTNGEEWHLMIDPLFFDPELWTMEKIKVAMDLLDKETSRATLYCHDLSDKGNAGGKCVKAFIESNPGVFVLKPKETKNFGVVSRAPWGCNTVKDSKRIDPPAEEDIIGWELNGKTRNY